MSVCLIDTGILCELLQVPNRCESYEEVYAELRRKIEAGETLLLPMAAIIETGNHIGQNGDGRQRRSAAERFVDFIRQALRGETPFVPTPFFEPEALLSWLEEFPNWAGEGQGFADLTIRREFEKQCALHRMRRVYIWTHDRHLMGYDRRP